MYVEGSFLKRNYFEAVRLLRLAAQKSHSRAQVKLAELLIAGKGTARLPVEAVMWYLKAANQGSVTAMAELGNCYENGIGCRQDIDTAIDWYEKAASLGSNLGSDRIIALVANPALLGSLITHGYAARAA